MSDSNEPLTWLNLPDVAEQIGVTVSRVRRLLEDRELLAVRRDGVLQVPSLFLRDGAPLKDLRGTVIVLADAGFSDEDAMVWLLEEQDEIGDAPVNALRSGRKSEVRRVAQALA
ncbi:hypothetical protein SAMN04489806_3328 [Paramicrobacterium humi]|uniref:Uncharacterized protein n=1 Tax=Paramicrobacterium humi TaxID=640635 RepID=A0A1H4TUZ1_9MICO|nr:Rv2175c family DNA-binding protein [Microbacterium humi]SEC60323.1 hypothetical protein SAMN04489806_3328 [Microbacterium humi]